MQHLGSRTELLRGAFAAALAATFTACALPPGAITGGREPRGGEAAGQQGSAGQGGAPGAGGNGTVGGGGAAGQPMGPMGMAPPAPSACKTNLPGPRALRRLTTAQLAASIRDLIGDQNLAVDQAVDDPVALGFRVDAALLVVRGLDAGRIRDVAEQVAHVAATTKLDQLIPCKTTDTGCRQTFIRSFGKRAFRAPLTDDQVKAYDTLFAAEDNVADGVEAVVSAMLQSPSFLYRRELGTASGGTFRLTPHELASSLSYLIWNTTPDDQLLAAADANALSTPEQIGKQVDRLLASPRSADAVKAFFHGWLDLDRLDTVVKDDKVYPVGDDLRADMRRETDSVVSDLFAQGAPFASLFSTSSTYVNPKLATLYGLTVNGTDFQKVTIASDKRAGGLLSHASVLTAHSTATSSSPVQRGKLVRTRLLCQDLPPPPSNLNTMLTAPQPNETTRERFARHSKDPVCAACHKRIDPVGFGFEEYDGVGRRRDQENGKPIDASGAITEIDGADVTFTGLGELSDKLAKSSDARACFVRFYSYFAFGKASWAEDTCTYDAIGAVAAKSDHSIAAVIRGVVASPTFTQRVQDQ